MMKTHFAKVLLLLTTFFCTGCSGSLPAPSLPSPTSEPETPTQISTSSAGTPGSWKFTPTSQPQVYSSILSTIVTQMDTPNSRRDSLTTRASYSISTTRNSDSLFYSGLITSFSVQGAMPDTLESQLIFPISFTGKTDNHSMSILIAGSRSEDFKSCSDISQAPLRTVQRNLFLLPLEITERQTWTDSTSSTVCNGTIPLTVTSIRTFHVVGESELDGSPALVFDQNERTFSTGEGSQGQHRIIIGTQGSTTGRFYLDRSSGQLLASNVISKIVLSIQSSGRTQQFSQNSTEVTRRAR